MYVLIGSAFTIALVHTLIGPDHYLPFIVLGRAEGWPLRKTLIWTAVCGLAHVLSSIVLGSVGIALGWALSSMEAFEGNRGAVAAYSLIGFGSLYFLWGLWRGRRGHSHVHSHADGSVHAHAHAHEAAGDDRRHDQKPHDERAHLQKHQRTLWILFTIFVLGPCEPLIPLLLVPAAHHSVWGIAAVAGVFGVTTIATMVTVVALCATGLRSIRFRFMERYVHAMAGFTLVVSGLAVQALGL